MPLYRLRVFLQVKLISISIPVSRTQVCSYNQLQGKVEIASLNLEGGFSSC